MGVKKSYRLRMDYSVKELVIQHLGAPEEMKVRVELGGVDDELMRELIDNEEEAPALVEEWVKSKRVTTEEGEKLLSALAQVLS